MFWFYENEDVIFERNHMMDFLRVWIKGYYSPNKFIDELLKKQTPMFGFFAVLIRSGSDALLLYLPLHISGRVPTNPSYLAFIPADKQYLFSIFIMPIYLIFLWLFLCSLIYIIIRAFEHKVNMDHILNITGMTSLVVGIILIPWDWIWVLCNWNNPYLLGTSHLIIDLWAMTLFVVGFHRILNWKMRFIILLSIIWILIAVPISILFVTPPL